MDFQTTPPPQQLPEAPAALVVQAEASPNVDIVDKFFESAARTFEQGKLAGKSEEEIIELTARLVTGILIAKNLGTDYNLMQAFFEQKKKIQDSFPKPITEVAIAGPELGILAKTRKRIQASLRGVLI